MNTFAAEPKRANSFDAKNKPTLKIAHKQNLEITAAEKITPEDKGYKAPKTALEEIVAKFDSRLMLEKSSLENRSKIIEEAFQAFRKNSDATVSEKADSLKKLYQDHMICRPF